MGRKSGQGLQNMEGEGQGEESVTEESVKEERTLQRGSMRACVAYQEVFPEGGQKSRLVKSGDVDGSVEVKLNGDVRKICFARGEGRR